MDVSNWQSLSSQVDESLRKTEAAARNANQLGNISSRRPEFRKKVNGIRENELRQLSGSLDQYRSNPRNHGVSVQDITSFSNKLDNLRALLQNIEDLCKNDNVRANLLSGDNSGKVRTSRIVEENDETKDLTNRDLLDQQVYMREKDDDALDEISSGLFSLKQIGLTHQKQFERQGELLNELHDGVDNTQQKLDTNILRVDKVERNSRGGCLALIFMTLMLGLILSVVVSNWICVILPDTKRRCSGSSSNKPATTA